MKIRRENTWMRRVVAWAVWLFLISLAYLIVGHGLIKMAYEGRALPSLNNFFEGRGTHELSFYYHLADRAFFKLLAVLGVCWAGISFTAPAFLRWVRRHPDTAALFFGILISVFLLTILEAGLWLFGVGISKFDLDNPPGYIVRNEHGMYVGTPGRHRLIATSVRTGKPIYDVIYEIDEFGRRVTPMVETGQRSEYLLFVGGSNTYGHGIQGNETLPAQVAAAVTGFRPYNYGFDGFGPFDILTQLRTHDLRREVAEKSGIMVYTYMDDHIHRTIGSLSVMRWKGRGVIYRENDKGEMVPAGDFTTGRPVRTFIFKTLGKSRLLRALKFDIPREFSQKDFELTARAIEAMRDEYLRQYPDGKFFVMIKPGTHYGGNLIPLFERAGISCLDYHDLYDTSRAENQVAKFDGDSHPTGLAWSHVVPRLIKDLNLH